MNAGPWPPVDRTGWALGPWDDEPDFQQWIHAATGLVCYALRHHSFGSWCGYVCLPPSHPRFGVALEVAEDRFEVHGGVTYAGRNDAWVGPAVSDPDPVFWIVGFDCAHAGDRSPGLEARLGSLGHRFTHAHESYKALSFVRGMVDHLAYQLGPANPAPVDPE